MPDPSRQDSVERFTGLSDCYAKYRPSYPPAALDHVVQRCGLRPESLLIDIGCGTGISSRLFAERGLRVVGIEPNAEMRDRAEAEPSPAGLLAPTYRAGSAEATAVADATADAVLAAQAFHWFDAERALRELHRILKPGGWVILMWNERDARDPCTAAYGTVVGGTPEAARLESHRSRAGEVILTYPLFQDAQRVLFRSIQELDETGLLGRALSVSYAPREPDEIAQYVADLRAVFARFQKSGKVVLHYETTVYTAQTRSRLNVVQDSAPDLTGPLLSGSES